MKLSPWTVAAIAISPLAAGVIGAAIATTPPVMASSAPRASVTVATFNDGFADAKLDDCQQGFAPACAWLKHARPAVAASSGEPSFCAAFARMGDAPSYGRLTAAHDAARGADGLTATRYYRWQTALLDGRPRPMLRTDLASVYAACRRAA